jgi:ribosomal protein L4
VWRIGQQLGRKARWGDGASLACALCVGGGLRQLELALLIY